MEYKRLIIKAVGIITNSKCFEKIDFKEILLKN